MRVETGYVEVVLSIKLNSSNPAKALDELREFFMLDGDPLRHFDSIQTRHVQHSVEEIQRNIEVQRMIAGEE